jgi:hypothetical protein
MTFTEILAEVQLLSKRGDIDDKIRAAIRMVTLRAHRLDYFYRDFIEAQLQWPTEQTLIDINVQTYLSRYRAIRYVRYWDPVTFAYGNMLDVVDARDVLDDHNYEKQNRWYMAGDILKVKCQYPTRGLQVGYYCSPVVYPYAQYSSWIATHFPDIIIQGALAQVFNETGKQEEARAINQLVGFEVDPGRSATRGPTLVEQLRQFALEEIAR